MKIGLVTIPINPAGVPPLKNLIDVLSISHTVSVITGDAGYEILAGENVHQIANIGKGGESLALNSVNYIPIQLRMLLNVWNQTDIDLWIFYIGGSVCLLPILLAKLLIKPVLIAYAGSDSQSLEGKNRLISKLVGCISSISFRLVNGITVPTVSILENEKIKQYTKKVYVAREHYCDIQKFRIYRPIGNRMPLIGFVGRLCQEKGIMNFISSIFYLNKKVSGLGVCVAGTGNQEAEIRAYLKQNEIENVHILGWIPHEKLADLMNGLKLVVIPSYTESGPLVALEAMACGTPVLATKVGFIPDYIKHNISGFILQDNRPESIADGIREALAYRDIGNVSINARALIEREFSLSKSTEQYNYAIEQIMLKEVIPLW